MKGTANKKESSGRHGKKSRTAKRVSKRLKPWVDPQKIQNRDPSRAVKKQLTLRLDADVVAWFKENTVRGEGYQTEMNRVLREHVRRARARKNRRT